MTGQDCSTRLEEVTGHVFEIQRFCVHDGPGVRTTVFLEGCPLRCVWCQNPEAWSTDSRRMSAGAVIDEVLRDRPFYDDTGGVTLSGGEPLASWAFASAMLGLARLRGVGTCVQTSGQVSWSRLERAAGLADVILVDIKHMHSPTHASLTGAGNERILDNIARALRRGLCVRPRYPLIPEVNDSDDNLVAMADFLSSCGCEQLRIVPYRNYYLAKPAARRPLALPQLARSCTADRLGRAREILSRHGLSTVVDA